MPKAVQKTNRPNNPPVSESVTKLAERRVSRAIRFIALCGNLVNHNLTVEQRKEVIGALQRSVDSVALRLRGEPMFRLSHTA